MNWSGGGENKNETKTHCHRLLKALASGGWQQAAFIYIVN